MKLDGIRVLDLSRFLPGPWVGQTLADHGAEVIKIESHEGEPTRRLGPAIKGFPAYFRNTQRGKLSLRLNLKDAEGLEIFLRLAAESDVIIESFRPGVADRIGIGYAAVRARNPGIVYCSLSAFGQTGPHAQRPSHDLGAQALTGVLSLSRHAGGAPAMPTLPMADIALGSAATIGILMALLRRHQTQQGDFIDVSMIDTLMSWTPHILSPVLHDHKAPDLASERLHGGAAFYNIYRTKDDRYIVLSGAEMNFVETLLTALGRPDLIEVCRRPWGPAQDSVRAFLTETFATRTRDEWDAWLREQSVCYAPVLELDEAWRQPVLRERDMVRTGEDGTEHLGTPILFAAEPGNATSRVAQLGEHTDAILERLGYDEPARQRLKKTGVC
ncbi:MAG: CoA transferase [Alphaproteobacteria bacterium]|nr:CoA transferase [Alphaproteobacteria bacterium]